MEGTYGKIMNMENEWDQMVEADMAEGPVEGVTDEKVMKAMNKMKLGKAGGPSEVNMDMILASGKFGVGVIKKLCQRVFDGKSLPKEWKTNVVVPIFTGIGGVMDCGACRGVKLLEHAMKIVERVLENRIGGLVTIHDMQFGFMPGRAQLMHCLFLEECKRSFVEERKSCTCVLWTWKRHLIGYREK